MQQQAIIAAVKSWLAEFVVGLNLCPFAGRELSNNRVRFAVTAASSESQLLAALEAELVLLNTDQTVETTLLIHPQVLQDFFDYNEFLHHADALLARLDLEGVYQIASFHPDYQFAGTAKDDAENYTNRSPYPLLHILREDSLEQAIAAYPNVEKIPEENIKKMNELGVEKLVELMRKALR